MLYIHIYIFQRTNYNKKMFHNITREERTALKETKTLENGCVRVQNKGSRFVILLNEDYCLKVNTQIERDSFITLPRDVTKSFEKKVDNFVLKWENLKVLDERWVKYIRSSHAKPGSMYGLIKGHKGNNPARVITSGCGIAIEFSSTFVEKYLYQEVDKINSRIKETPDMPDIIDDINNSNMITDSSILVSFDIVYMFPSIGNISDLEAVSEILSNSESDFPPAECILEALTIFLEFNNSVIDNVFYLQENGTAMYPHMSCSYSDRAMYRFDIKAFNYRPGVQCWKRFRDDIFCLTICLSEPFFGRITKVF